MQFPSAETELNVRVPKSLRAPALEQVRSGRSLPLVGEVIVNGHNGWFVGSLDLQSMLGEAHVQATQPTK